MKVTLDLTELLREGRIGQDEHDKLAALGRRDTASLGFALLVGFGVVTVAAALLLLVPSAVTAVALGVALMAAGLGTGARRADWRVPADVVLLVGAVLLAGGIVVETDASLAGWVTVTAVCIVAAVLARSGLLAAAAVLALVAALGSGTGYGHASYMLVVTRPALTVIVCAGLALGGLVLSTRVGPPWTRLASIAARTALFCANLGFWVGSLWGDGEEPGGLTPLAFSLGWAAALLGVAVWAVRADRRWVLNVAAVFGAIHFYTQWFEHLSATPLSVLLAGLLALGAALALWRWNMRAAPPRSG